MALEKLSINVESNADTIAKSLRDLGGVLDRVAKSIKKLPGADKTLDKTSKAADNTTSSFNKTRESIDRTQKSATGFLERIRLIGQAIVNSIPTIARWGVTALTAFTAFEIAARVLRKTHADLFKLIAVKISGIPVIRTFASVIGLVSAKVSQFRDVLVKGTFSIANYLQTALGFSRIGKVTTNAVRGLAFSLSSQGQLLYSVQRATAKATMGNENLAASIRAVDNEFKYTMRGALETQVPKWKNLGNIIATAGKKLGAFGASVGKFFLTEIPGAQKAFNGISAAVNAATSSVKNFFAITSAGQGMTKFFKTLVVGGAAAATAVKTFSSSLWDSFSTTKWGVSLVAFGKAISSSFSKTVKDIDLSAKIAAGSSVNPRSWTTFEQQQRNAAGEIIIPEPDEPGQPGFHGEAAAADEATNAVEKNTEAVKEAATAATGWQSINEDLTTGLGKTAAVTKTATRGWKGFFQALMDAKTAGLLLAVGIFDMVRGIGDAFKTLGASLLASSEKTAEIYSGVQVTIEFVKASLLGYNNAMQASTDIHNQQNVTLEETEAHLAKLSVGLGIPIPQLRQLTALMFDFGRTSGLTSTQLWTFLDRIIEISAATAGEEGIQGRLNSVFEEFIAAAGGAQQAVRNYGINVEMAALVSEGFVDAQKAAAGTLSFQEETMGRINKLLHSTAIFTGIAEKRSSTFSGAMEKLRNAAQLVNIELGKGASVILSPFATMVAKVSSLVTKLPPLLLNVAGGVKAVGGVVATGGGSLLSMAGSGLKLITTVHLISAVIRMFSKFLAPLLTQTKEYTGATIDQAVALRAADVAFTKTSLNAESLAPKVTILAKAFSSMTKDSLKMALEPLKKWGIAIKAAFKDIVSFKAAANRLWGTIGGGILTLGKATVKVGAWGIVLAAATTVVVGFVKTLDILWDTFSLGTTAIKQIDVENKKSLSTWGRIKVWLEGAVKGFLILGKLIGFVLIPIIGGFTLIIKGLELAIAKLFLSQATYNQLLQETDKTTENIGESYKKLLKSIEDDIAGLDYATAAAKENKEAREEQAKAMGHQSVATLDLQQKMKSLNEYQFLMSQGIIDTALAEKSLMEIEQERSKILAEVAKDKTGRLLVQKQKELEMLQEREQTIQQDLLRIQNLRADVTSKLTSKTLGELTTIERRNLAVQKQNILETRVITLLKLQDAATKPTSGSVQKLVAWKLKNNQVEVASIDLFQAYIDSCETTANANRELTTQQRELNDAILEHQIAIATANKTMPEWRGHILRMQNAIKQTGDSIFAGVTSFSGPFVAALAPFASALEAPRVSLEKLGEGILSVTADGVGMAVELKSIVDPAMEAYVQQLIAAEQALRDIEKAGAATRKSFLDMAQEMDVDIGTLNSYELATSRLQSSLVELPYYMRDAFDIDNIDSFMAALDHLSNLEIAAFEGPLNAILDQVKAMRDVRIEAKESRREFASLALEQQAMSGAFSETELALKEISIIISKLPAKYQDVVKGLRTFADLQAYVTSLTPDQLAAIGPVLEELGQKFLKMGSEAATSFNILVRIGQEAAAALTSAMSEGFFQLFTGQLTSLKELFDSFLDDILRSMSRMLANMVVNQFLSALGSIIPGAGGLPTLLGIPAFAEGGIVRSPTLATVGESGPEAVIPLDRMHMMQQQPMQVTVINAVGRPEDLVAQGVARAPNVIINPVLQDSRMNGRTRSMLRNAL